jgi:hypothetical protein
MQPNNRNPLPETRRMPELPPLIPCQIDLTPAQLNMVDSFQTAQHLPTRMAALQILLDIALEAVTSRGKRFWDTPIVKPPE